MNHHSITSRLPHKFERVTAELRAGLSMPSPEDWARTELPIRKAEDARFPTLPTPYTREYDDFCEMKTKRRIRRKALGLSRSQAEYYLRRAERMDG